MQIRPRTGKYPVYSGARGHSERCRKPVKILAGGKNTSKMDINLGVFQNFFANTD
jgi:hypothetical protein